MKDLAKLLLLIIALSALSGCGFLYDYLGGNFRGEPYEMDDNISEGARGLIRKAFETVDSITDTHVHIVARGTSNQCQGAYIHPDLYTWRRPILRLKTRVLMSASGVDDYENLDEQYALRLQELLLHFQEVQGKYAGRPVKSRFFIYALDDYYDDDGDRQSNPERTDLRVPDDCVIRLAERFNRVLGSKDSGASPEVIPVASVHPYRGDFKKEVRRLAEQGIRFMKWLPPSMNIDLSKVLLAHYQALADAGITLLVHTGNEHTLRVYGENQLLGDPFLLSHPLDAGVTVVALHVGREGKFPADDASYFERFMEMMGKAKYKGRLFGELSAITIDKTPLSESSQPLIPEIIKEAHSGVLQGRIRNGSDYPLAAVAYLNPTRGLVKRSLITREEKKWLDEIYAYNPLLFDFVVKRTLKHPDSRESLPPGVFRQFLVWGSGSI